MFRTIGSLCLLLQLLALRTMHSCCTFPSRSTTTEYLAFKYYGLLPFLNGLIQFLNGNAGMYTVQGGSEKNNLLDKMQFTNFLTTVCNF